MIGDAFDRVVDALEEHNCKPRGSLERGVYALCPAHDDRNPSLSVAYKGEKALVKCHAGCETEAILDALALPWEDLFDEPRVACR
jgi:hypothetical protein